MNTTGCQAQLARDDLLLMDPSASPISPCILVIPLYATLLAIYTLVLGLVAFSRTRYILKRTFSRSATRSGKTGSIGWVQTVTITQSWLSCINCFLILIVPFVYGSAHNVIVFLFGVQNVLYAISSERWLTKLIRLGSKIIGKRYTTSSKQQLMRSPGSPRSGKAEDSNNDSGTDDNEFAAMDNLRHLDLFLKIMMTSIRLMTVFLFISFCVLTLVFPTERRWLSAGLGAQSFLVCTSLIVLVYQYQRCKTAIIQTQKHVQAMLKNNSRPPEEKDGIKNVLKKFTRHQLILTVTGGPTWILLLLWAVSVIPINHATILVAMGIDVIVNGSMFFTFVLKSATKGGKTTTKSNRLVGGGDQQAQLGIVAIADLDKKAGSSSGAGSEGGITRTKTAMAQTTTMVAPSTIVATNPTRLSFSSLGEEERNDK